MTSPWEMIGYDESDKDRVNKTDHCCLFCDNFKDGITASTCLWVLENMSRSIVVEDWGVCENWKSE